MQDLKFLKSGLVLFLFAVLGAASAFLLQVMMARALGPESYGYFISLYSGVLIITPLAGFGVGPFLLRLCSREGASGVRWFSSVNKYLMVTSLIAFILPVVLVPSYPLSMKVMLASMVFVAALLEVLSVKFQLEGRYAMLAVWQFFPNFSRLICVGLACLVYQSSLNAQVLSGAILISSIVVISISLRFEALVKGKGVGVLSSAVFSFNKTKCVRESDICTSRASFSQVVIGAWPFGVSSFLFLAYFQAAVPLTGHFVGLEEAAIISVCITLLTAFYLLPVVLYQKALASRISFSVYNDLDAAKSIFFRAGGAMLLLGISVALLLFLLAEQIVVFLFGAEYFEAAVLMKLLALAVPARYFGANAGAFYIYPKLAIVKVLMLLGVVVFNLLFIATFHSEGIIIIVYSLLISEYLLAALLFLGSLSVFRGRYNE